MLRWMNDLDAENKTANARVLRDLDVSDAIVKTNFFSFFEDGVFQHAPVLGNVFNAPASGTVCPCATFVEELQEVKTLLLQGGAGSA